MLTETAVTLGSVSVVAAASSSSVALSEPDRYVANMTARPSRTAPSNKMAPFRFWELHVSLFSSVKMFLVASLKLATVLELYSFPRSGTKTIPYDAERVSVSQYAHGR